MANVLALVGDDPPTQTLVEAVWKYRAQMEARKLGNPINYVSYYRIWRQLKIEQQQGILSRPFQDGEHDAHLSIPESNITVIVELSESTNCGAEFLTALQVPALPTLSIPETNADAADVVSNTGTSKWNGDDAPVDFIHLLRGMQISVLNYCRGCYNGVCKVKILPCEHSLCLTCAFKQFCPTCDRFIRKHLYY